MRDCPRGFLPDSNRFPRLLHAADATSHKKSCMVGENADDFIKYLYLPVGNFSLGLAAHDSTTLGQNIIKNYKFSWISIENIYYVLLYVLL